MSLRRSGAAWAVAARAGTNAALRAVAASTPEFRAAVCGLRVALAADALDVWIDQRIASVVRAARRHVPAYGDLLQGLPGTAIDRARLADLPVVSKHTFCGEAPERWLSRRVPCVLRRRVKTSGSTGDPFVFFRSRRFTDYALTTHVMREFDRWTSGGPPTRLVSTWSEPGMLHLHHEVRSIYPRRLYVSNLDPEGAAAAVRAFDPELIEGRAQTVFRLLLELERADGVPPSLRAVCFTQETLFEHQRREVEGLAGVPVFGRYGSEELTGALAHSCRAGRYHVHPLLGYVEILDDDGRPVAPGQVGRIVATSFVNTAMPFIRYDTGDVAMRPDVAACECGCPYPSFGSLEVSRRHAIHGRDGTVFTDALIAQHLILELDGVASQVQGFQYRQLGSAHWRMEVCFRPDVESGGLLRRMQAQADALFGDRLALEVSPTRDLWRTGRGKRVLVKALGEA